MHRAAAFEKEDMGTKAPRHLTLPFLLSLLSLFWNEPFFLAGETLPSAKVS